MRRSTQLMLAFFLTGSGTAASAPRSLEIAVRSTPKVVPGTPLLVDLRAPASGYACTLRARKNSSTGETAQNASADAEIPLRADAAGERFTGILGIDLEAPTRPFELQARCQPVDGPEPVITATRKVSVLPAAYPTERLRVEQKYVEPDPQVEQRIAAEKARMDATLAVVSPLAPMALTLRAPVAGPSRNFGVRRVFNGVAKSPHNGADFRVGKGTPVASAGTGRVVLTGDLYYSGNTVVIDHGGGIFTLYAHLNGINVKEGDVVATGDRVGTVGATGRVTGPHLHFAARVLGARVDPIALIHLLAGGQVRAGSSGSKRTGKR